MSEPLSPLPRRNRIAPAETPGLNGLLTLAVGVAVMAALSFGRDIFIPIVIAVLLGFVLAPLVDLLRRVRLGRVPSVIVAVILALGLIGGLAMLIGTQMAQLAGDLPRYEVTIRDKADSLKEGAIGRLSGLMRHLGREIEKAANEPNPETPAAPAAPQEPEPPKPMPVEVHQPDATPVQILRRLFDIVVEPLATAGIVFVVLVFILLQREDLRDRMIRLFGSDDLHRTTVAMDEAARRLSRYFLIQVALNSAFGVFVGLGLWAIGLPSPLLWGVMAALMRFIPYIGSFIAGLFPVILAAAVDPGWSMVVMTLLLFVVSEPIMGHVVEPVAYGQGTGLSPFAVVVAAIFWTWLWGPIGLLLSTPLTLCLVVLGRHVERLEFLDVLFGDRPALTPVENFYQRMLAGDPDEAQEHAEQLLKERSLSSYYDEVALKGLQLAANDAGRGVLTEEQLERIKDAITGLVADLASHDDVAPKKADKADVTPAGPSLAEKDVPKLPDIEETAPPSADLPAAWRTENAVLCIAGRGPLDEAASAMLAQLLRKHGLGAKTVPHEAVSRSNVIGLDVTGVAMVCISYLEIRGNPAHLRYLLRRLRQKLPGAPLLVGLWPAEASVLTDEALKKQIGADYYVVSLRDGVKAALESARKASEQPEPAGDAPPRVSAQPAALARVPEPA